MECRELVQVITDYLEGAMAARDRERFEAHLRECPYCVTYVEQMRQTISVLGELEPESIHPETRSDLLRAFRGWRR
jgi:anti-sigma factor RsiW